MKSLKIVGIILASLLVIAGLSIGGYKVIKSYEIDIDSIKHNPMGGIDFKVYVNSDKKLRVMYGLEKDSNTGKIEYSGGGYSAQLAELLKKVKNDTKIYGT